MHLNQTHSISLCLIHMDTHALVCGRVGAVIHVLFNVMVIWDLVCHVKSLHVQNFTAPLKNGFSILL